MRDLWISVFEGYARACYDACTAITTLYSDNQHLQLALGAEARKLRVIPNGIDISRFQGSGCASPDDRPTVALIGRVVPIKDVKTFIAAAATIRQRIANLRVLVMGPTDEDEAYFEECGQLVADFGMSDCVTFTGSVRIADLLPTIHVVVLTSLSEAQPLVLLEAGAAGIPCVATNVGACREIIEGTAGEEVTPEPGGFVTESSHPIRSRIGCVACLRTSLCGVSSACRFEDASSATTPPTWRDRSTAHSTAICWSVRQPRSGRTGLRWQGSDFRLRRLSEQGTLLAPIASMGHAAVISHRPVAVHGCGPGVD